MASIMNRLGFCAVIAAVVGMGVFSASSPAGIIQVQFSGLDIAYDGAAISDADPSGGDPDPLSSVSFFDDGILAGPVLTTDLSIDLDIPGVTGIPVGGGLVTSAAGGTLDLEFGGADHLYLDLSSVTISYVDVVGLFQFAFGGTVGGIAGQSLPYGLVMGDPVTASFSTQLSASSDDGTFLTSFTSSGTGEVKGIPEPAAVSLIIIGAMASFAGFLRRRWG